MFIPAFLLTMFLHKLKESMMTMYVHCDSTITVLNYSNMHTCMKTCVVGMKYISCILGVKLILV